MLSIKLFQLVEEHPQNICDFSSQNQPLQLRLRHMVLSRQSNNSNSRSVHTLKSLNIIKMSHFPKLGKLLPDSASQRFPARKAALQWSTRGSRKQLRGKKSIRTSWKRTQTPYHEFPQTRANSVWQIRFTMIMAWKQLLTSNNSKWIISLTDLIQKIIFLL